MENFISKVDSSITNFRFNVSIALFHEFYNFFKNNLEKKIGNNVFQECLIKFMKLLIPFSPHLAYESLELLNCKKINSWPEIKKNFINDVNLAVQVNGKTRDIIKLNRDLSENEVKDFILKNSKAKKYIENSKISKFNLCNKAVKKSATYIDKKIMSQPNKNRNSCS